MGSLEAEAFRGNHQEEGIGSLVVSHPEVGMGGRLVEGREDLLAMVGIRLALGAYLCRQVLKLVSSETSNYR